MDLIFIFQEEVIHNWYLFRLPLYNAYCNFNKIGQQTTLTPELSKEEIIKIYNLKVKKNYKKI